MESTAGSSRELTLKSLNSDSEDISSIKNTKEISRFCKCFYCQSEQRYDYKGTKPPFAKHLTFIEDCYIIKYPFSDADENEVLVVGSDCSMCKNSACLDCSLFYQQRFCKVCALKNIEQFPLRLQKKIKILNQL